MKHIVRNTNKFPDDFTIFTSFIRPSIVEKWIKYGSLFTIHPTVLHKKMAIWFTIGLLIMLSSIPGLFHPW